MKIKDIVRLLIINESQNDAEEITNLFRNSGYPTRTHRLDAIAELAGQLAQDQWDLLITDERCDTLPLEEVLATLRDSGEDIPVLLLSEDCKKARGSALETGVREVIAADDPQHLLHAALREVAGRRVALENDKVRETLEELQARYELLMGGSQDAIAYITDGMHVDVNEAYASKFGYGDTDELACLPVIDLIAAGDQDKFKQFLRKYNQNGAQAGEPGQGGGGSDATLEVTAQHLDGSELSLQMVFAPASYEDEECTQIVIHAGASGGGQQTADHRHFLADLAQQLLQTKRQAPSALVYLHLDNMPQLREDFGILAAEDIVRQLESLLQKELPTEALIGKITSDGYAALLPGCSTQSALQSAHEWLGTVRQHIFEVDDRSARCQCVAAVLGIGEKASDSVETLVNQAFDGVVELFDNPDGPRASVYTPPVAPIQIGCANLNLDELYHEGRLQLLYQPIVSLRGDPGEYYEVEAVFQDADNAHTDIKQVAAGMLSGSKGSLFDRWLIFATTKRLAQKRSQGSDTRMIINITAACLQDRELSSWLGVSLNAAGLPPESLILQLDEADAKASLKQAARFFGELKDIGCLTSISNFGQLPESGTTLQHVGANLIKVEPKIEENGQMDDTARQALKKALNEAVNASATSIVTNVSSAATLATLWQLGAGFIQGSYLQEPTAELEYEFAEIA